MLPIISRLVDDIDLQWGSLGYDPGEFPGVAAACLRAHAPHRHIDLDELIDWALGCGRLPDQFDLTASFGQPPLTVAVAERFFVDAYFWVTPDTVIHDHGFSGAFTNLAGNSLMCVYRFADTHQPHPAMRVGALTLDYADYLIPGSVVPITAGRSFIHRVWHLSRPTVTLLARVPSAGAPFEQWRYAPPGVAVRKAWARSPEVTRRRQLTAFLYQTGHPARERRAREAVLAPDAFDACEALQQYYALNATELSAPDLRARVDSLVARLCDLHGEWASVLPEALRLHGEERAVNWDRVTDPDARLLLATRFTFGPPPGPAPGERGVERHSFPGERATNDRH